MNSNLMDKYWDHIKQKLKQDFNSLDSKDLEYNSGNEDELIERIMKKTGQSKEEILYLIYIYVNNFKNEYHK